MKTIKFPFQDPDKNTIKSTLLDKDGIVVYPTETFYALGCSSKSGKAVEKIYRIKKRDPKLPLLVLINSWEMLDKYATEVNTKKKKILEENWPGPVTAVLKLKKNLAKGLNKNADTLGFRMTSSPIAQQIIEIAGVPLVGTSANVSSGPESITIESAKSIFGNQVDLYIDGGECEGGLPSTLVDMTSNQFKILRKGKILLSV